MKKEKFSVRAAAALVFAALIALSCATKQNAADEGQETKNSDEVWTPVEIPEDIIGRWEGSITVPVLEKDSPGFPASTLILAASLSYNGRQAAEQSVSIDFNVFLADLQKKLKNREYTKASLWDQFVVRNYSDPGYSKEKFTITVKYSLPVEELLYGGESSLFLHDGKRM
jgi:hypothetical protein